MERILQNLNLATIVRNVFSTFLVAIVFISASHAKMRGRVKIQNGNVVAENGTTLRAAPFFVDIDWGIPHMLDNEEAYRNYFKTVSRDHHMNMVRACPWLGRYDYMMNDVVNQNTGETAGDRVRKMLDLLVQWSEEDGIYLLINSHSQIGTNVDFYKWKSFWDLVAPRYKDKTHVFYEATNEPEENSAINNMESMYNYIRGKAPNTHISLWSHWNSGFTLQTIQSKSGINYSNASVGFHTYLSEGDLEAWDRAKDIRNAGFPVICTELWSLTNANDLPIDYNELSLHIQRGEQLGMSWSQWGPYANYRGYNPSPQFDNSHDQIKFTSQYRSSIENRGVSYWARDTGGGGQSFPDAITSIDGPNTVSPNGTYNVNFGYTSSANKDIHVILQLNRSPWTVYGSKVFDVSEGEGNINANISVNGNTPLGSDEYKWQAFITNDGAGWENQTGFLLESGIDVVAGVGNDNGGGGSGEITIRARGNCGAETLQLRVNGSPVQTWDNISTSQSNYTYSGYSGGDISVHFTNDGSSNGCDKNMFVNYIEVCGERYQTESTATRTGCGDDEWLWCTGNFAFGDLGCTSGGGDDDGGNTEGGDATIIVNARGTSGSEQIELLFDDSRVGNITTLSTSDQSYLFNLPSASGNVKVKFINDANGRDVRIDWIQINGGTVIQAENQGTNTGVWNAGQSRCGGISGEWLHCPGYIDFGNRNLRKGDDAKALSTFEIYPNPANNKGRLNVSSSLENYAFKLYDIKGVLVASKEMLNGNQVIQLSNVGQGVFSAVITDGTAEPQIKRLILK